MSKRELNRIDVLARLDGRRLTASAAADLMRVTVRQTHRPDFSLGDGKQPVVGISWSDAKMYVSWLSRSTGKPYRLLSEAEREYVTRAGTATAFWWGSTITAQQANYESRRGTVGVDSFTPNPWGLYQVHGNAHDWVEDCYHDTYQGAPTNGSAWIDEDCKSHVLRGGSWTSPSSLLRAASRASFPVSIPHGFNTVGLRVARTLSP